MKSVYGNRFNINKVNVLHNNIGASYRYSYYKQIADVLHESPKKIDNTAQRIRRKIKDVVDVLQMDSK